MSEVVKLSSKEVKNWLERETSSTLVPVHSKAQDLLKEMKEILDDYAGVCKVLMDNTAKEIEKRNPKTYRRARAFNKLAKLFLDRVRQIKVPEKVTYDAMKDFVQETQRALAVTDVDVRNWFPRISPFFILDRRRFQFVFEKAKLMLKEINEFVTKDYVKTKTLEDTFQLIDRVAVLEQQADTLKQRKMNVDSDRADVERSISDFKQKIAELRSRGSISQLSQAGSEIETLSAKVKQNLQHLQKPFIKLQAQALHGEGSGLTPDELKKLGEYVEDPFEAFSTDGPNYSLLKQILRKVDAGISEGKLRLKPEKARKAKQMINEVLAKDSLRSLHEESTLAVARKTEISASTELASVQQDISKLERQLEGLTMKKIGIETEQQSLQTVSNETLERIQNHKGEIEKSIFNSVGKRVNLE